MLVEQSKMKDAHKCMLSYMDLLEKNKQVSGKTERQAYIKRQPTLWLGDYYGFGSVNKLVASGSF